MNVYNYQVFGLAVASELELPELMVGGTEAAPDVVIQRGAIVGEWQPGLHKDGDRLVLVIPDIARFRIADGRSIIVEALAGVPDRNVRLFLLGSAFGALLHQRGLLPLHANAVEIEGKAVAFMGESGAGKSTLAAWFHDRGHRVLADDVCVVSPSGPGSALVLPGLPRLRLWAEALTATGRDMREYERSYAGETDYEKYDVPLQNHGGVCVPLAAIYLLVRGKDLKFERLTGVAAARALFAHTYRGAFVEFAGRQVDHWSACLDLLRSTPMLEVQRPWNFDAFDAEAEAIATHAASLMHSGSGNR